MKCSGCYGAVTAMDVDVAVADITSLNGSSA